MLIRPGRDEASVASTTSAPSRSAAGAGPAPTAAMRRPRRRRGRARARCPRRRRWRRSRPRSRSAAPGRPARPSRRHRRRRPRVVAGLPAPRLRRDAGLGAVRSRVTGRGPPSRRGARDPPCRAATISARIESAVSCGLSPPRSSPSGECSRASVLGRRPARAAAVRGARRSAGAHARRRTRRAGGARPAAPGRRWRSSWVRTQIAVRGSSRGGGRREVLVRGRRRAAAASGKRSGVTRSPQPSHTVTAKPATAAATRHSAAAYSPAPRISRRGRGAYERVRMLSSGPSAEIGTMRPRRVRVSARRRLGDHQPDGDGLVAPRGLQRLDGDGVVDASAGRRRRRSPHRTRARRRGRPRR